MRYMALDVGDERIGVALSDEGGLLARPLETIRRAAGSASYERLREIIEEYGVEEIVVGLPLSADGSEGKQVASVRAYVRGMQAHHIQLPIVYWNEYGSTVRAEQVQIAGGQSRRRRRRRVDAVAAAVILQGFLDSQRRYV
ncbi:MAG: Holliday junction resolvase RuvX [Chloroflexi bacterium]|nr:Holliday junction resolvase RuvX [Chloroflexota bacterium]